MCEGGLSNRWAGTELRAEEGMREAVSLGGQMGCSGESEPGRVGQGSRRCSEPVTATQLFPGCLSGISWGHMASSTGDVARLS